MERQAGQRGINEANSKKSFNGLKQIMIVKGKTEGPPRLSSRVKIRSIVSSFGLEDRKEKRRLRMGEKNNEVDVVRFEAKKERSEKIREGKTLVT